MAVDGDVLGEVTGFIYLGSVVDKQGRTDANVMVRIRGVRAAFLWVKNIWASPGLTIINKMRIFNTTVEPALRSWNMETHDYGTEEEPDIHQHLPWKNPSYPVILDNQQ